MDSETRASRKRLIAMTVLALAVMLGVGAAAGFVLGRPGFGIGSALIIWFVLVLPALVVGQQRDTRLSLKLFFTMFRGGQGGP